MTDTTRHDGRPGADTTPTRRVTVKEAAALLDVSPDAIRARLRRGTLGKETGPDGRPWFSSRALSQTETVADTTGTRQPTRWRHDGPRRATTWGDRVSERDH